MHLGQLLKAPGAKRAVSIDLADYLGADTVSGSPAWVAATGIAIEGTPTLAANVATAIVSGGLEGCDYLLTCNVALSSGASEVFTVLIKIRTGEADPRLTR